MNKLLTKRLKNIGISRDGILKLLNPLESSYIVIYATCMEGLGTQGSDFDIYIIETEFYDNLEITSKRNHKVKCLI